MQLTVILAGQISQIEDSDDDITFLHGVYKEERRLHTFDRNIDTNTTDILGGGSK